jgi:hypothetical protein
MESRTHGAICLGWTGSLQGTYEFFSLKTRGRIKDSVIRQVELFGDREDLPRNLEFADCHGVLFKWNDEVAEADEPLINYPAEPPAILVELPGVDLHNDH